MAGTLLFIHGTGVRHDGYARTLKDLEAGLKKAGRGDIAVKGLPWGDQLGTKVDAAAIDAVLPLAKKKAIGDEPDPAEWEAALWAQLLQDPLYELRMAAMGAGPVEPALAGAAALPGQAALADQAVVDRVEAFRQSVADPLPGGVSAESLRAAVDWLKQTDELRQAALAAPSDDDADLAQAIARALVARVLGEARGQTGEGPDALYLVDERRALVAEVARQITPATKGLGGWLFGKVKGAAEALATAYGKTRRDELMAGVSPGVGDILLYQRRGDDILAAIEAEILKLAPGGGPLVVLGHSLGGIMLVDLLSRPRAAGPLPVAKLITIASQSPMFLKCDALGSMRLNLPLAAGAPYTPWLNIFDRNDFLSFCATRAFPGTPPGIEDFEVASGVPFPDSHGAYFRMKEVYEKIVATWP